MSSPQSTDSGRLSRFAWIGGVKVLALAGILINHLAEAFWLSAGAGSQNWLALPNPQAMSLLERAQTLWADQTSAPGVLGASLAWLGNEGPGVFILLSGLGLTLGYGLRHRVDAKAQATVWSAFIQQRAARLFPLYIASVLLFVPVWLVASPGIDWNMSGWVGLSMLTGVRASADVFGLLNPSWWFFWTILQLTLLFPLLLWCANRFGFARLFGLALLLTVAVRLSILQSAGDGNLWPQLTGMFGLSRLAEFAFGMWMASLLASGWMVKQRVVSPKGLFASVCFLTAGIGFSLTVFGGAVSQILLTIGFTGVLLNLWQLLAGLPRVSDGLPTLESRSYGIYLFHQPPLIVLAKALGQSWLALGLGVLAVVVVAALITPLQRTLRWVSHAFRHHGNKLAWLFSLNALILLGLLPVGEPHLGDGRARDLLTWGLAVFIVVTIWFNALQARVDRSHEWFGMGLRWVAVAAAAMSLWVFPVGGAGVACLVAIAGGLVYCLCAVMLRGNRRWPGFFTACVLTIVLVAGTEGLVRQYAQPMEAGRWAELPVLKVHETRGYAMKESVRTALRYHYEYQIETNDDGFQGRSLTARAGSSGQAALRIALLGDAFTMPEVVPYERSYAAHLERALSQCVPDRSVEVFNLGVTGYSPTEKIVLANEVLPGLAPDIVVDQIFKTELDWMLMSKAERRAAIGLTVDDESGYRDMWISSQFYQRARRVSSTISESYSGVIAPWRLQTALLGYFRASKQGTDWVSQREKGLADYWANLNEKAARDHYELVAFYTPAAIEVSAPGQLRYLPETLDLPLIGALNLDQPFDLIKRAADTGGVDLIDPRESFRALSLGGTQLYSDAYWHWTEHGHEAAAAVLQQALVERGLLPRTCSVDSVVVEG